MPVAEVIKPAAGDGEVVEPLWEVAVPPGEVPETVGEVVVSVAEVVKASAGDREVAARGGEEVVPLGEVIVLNAGVFWPPGEVPVLAGEIVITLGELELGDMPPGEAMLEFCREDEEEREGEGEGVEGVDPNGDPLESADDAAAGLEERGTPAGGVGGAPKGVGRHPATGDKVVTGDTDA